MQTLRQIVSGTDFSACAQHALEVALRLASAADARLTVVHVCELDAADQTDRHTQRCNVALASVVAGCRRSPVEVVGVLRCGMAWTKLDNIAAEVGAGLIVIGRHGAGRGRSVAIGSVADRMVRSAHRSVLTVTCDFDCPEPGAVTTHR